MARRAFVLAVAAVMLLPLDARAAVTRSVTIVDDAFSRSTITANAIDAVRWTRRDDAVGAHNVRQDGRIFRSGSPTEDAAFSYVVRFSAGTYHYYCEVHGEPAGGMAGYVRVVPVVSSSPDGLPFTLRWASSTTRTGTRFDVQYRIGSSTTWKVWRSNSTSVSGVFGANRSPVGVRDGTTYRFRVRSRKLVGETWRISGYSPVKSFIA